MSVKETVTTTINKTNNMFNTGLVYLINFVQSQTTSFFEFMTTQKVIQIGIGLLIASQIGEFTKSINENLIVPIVNTVMNNPNSKNLSEHKVTILGIEFKTGKLLINLINFILMILIVFLLWQFLQIGDFSFVNKGLDKFKPHGLSTSHVIGLTSTGYNPGANTADTSNPMTS